MTELLITGIGAQGDGVGEIEGKPVYLSGALPGDTYQVTLGKPGKYGTPVSQSTLLKEGPHHTDPTCQHYGKCGGCSLQHLDGGAYQLWLKGRLLDPLNRVGLEPETLLDPVITTPKTRRRISIKLMKRGKSVELGFLKKGSHNIVAIRECPVTLKALTDLFEPLKIGLERAIPRRGAIEISLTMATNGVDLVVRAFEAPDLALREWGAEFAEKYDIASFHWHDGFMLDPIVIRREPVMSFDGVSVGLPPASFIQAADIGEQALTAAAIDGLKKGDRVLDLFAGLGTFAIPASKKGAVVRAMDAAKEPMDRLSLAAGRFGLALSTEHRDLYRQPLTIDDLAGIDRVIIDPPRAGAEAQMRCLAGASVPHIVSISCNPATFARDSRILADGGYKLTTLQAVDQFLWSPHLEVVGVFEKG